MKLVNYQEDLVLHIAEIVLQDRPDVELSHELLLDTAAYALNRLPPRYIVSERGFTRLMADNMFDEDGGAKLGNLVELLFLINNAVDVVKKRRSAPSQPESEAGDGEEDDHIEPHWHNIPYLIGRVIDGEKKQPISDVQITLLVDGEKIGQAGSGWTNPYTTSGAAQGFYSFLPEPIHSEERKRKFSLRILFEGAGYESEEIERVVKTHGELAARRDFRNDGFINLGATTLTKVSS